MSIAIALNLATLFSDENSTLELRKLWNTLDKNDDGKVSSKEWGSAVGSNHEVMKKFFGGATKREIGQAFKRIDHDKSDSLTWDEFVSENLAFAASVKLAEAMKTDEGLRELKAFWDTLNTDGDQVVSSKEWGSAVYRNQEIMKKFFGGCTLAEIGKAFNRIDADGNGSLTWIEFEEAAKSYATQCDLIAAMESAEGMEDLKGLWKKLDKDGDGTISGPEWGKAVHADQELKKKYFGGSSIGDIGRAFRRIDADKNGELTWEEFVGATVA